MEVLSEATTQTQYWVSVTAASRALALTEPSRSMALKFVEVGMGVGSELRVAGAPKTLENAIAARNKIDFIFRWNKGVHIFLAWRSWTYIYRLWMAPTAPKSC